MNSLWVQAVPAINLGQYAGVSNNIGTQTFSIIKEGQETHTLFGLDRLGARETRVQVPAPKDACTALTSRNPDGRRAVWVRLLFNFPDDRPQ